MGKSGPAARPTALKLLHGVRPARINQNEPQPLETPLVAPEWLSPMAREEWDRVAPDLAHMRVAKSIDQTSLAAYCESFARFRAASEIVSKSGPLIVGKRNGEVVRNPAVALARDAGHDLLRWAREFGMTPSARTPLQVHHTGSIDSPVTLHQLLGS